MTRLETAPVLEAELEPAAENNGSAKHAAPSRLRIGEIEVSPRLTIKDIRRVKRDHGIDFSETTDESPLAKMQFDPIVLTEIVWAFYGPRLQQKGLASLDDLEEQLDDEQMSSVREALLHAIGGFFPLARTLSTQSAEALAGKLDLVELAKGIEAPSQKDNPSTSSSSP